MARRVERHRTIVLARTKLGEQDLILTMLDEDGSQVRAVAKGARKPGSRLAARTELFCQTDMVISYGRGLGIISEAEVVQAHARIRTEPQRVYAACALCEIARQTCYEEVADPFMFAILSRALFAIEEVTSPQNEALVVAGYAFKVLSHGGWRPVLDTCVACGEPDVTRFSVTGGGALCESCAKDVEGAHPISPQTLQWIDALIRSTFDVLVSCETDVQTSTELLTHALMWCSTHLDTRLRAFEFYTGR